MSDRCRFGLIYGKRLISVYGPIMVRESVPATTECTFGVPRRVFRYATSYSITCTPQARVAGKSAVYRSGSFVQRHGALSLFESMAISIPGATHGNHRWQAGKEKGHIRAVLSLSLATLPWGCLRPSWRNTRVLGHRLHLGWSGRMVAASTTRMRVLNSDSLLHVRN